jgi:hypothetical protein
MNCVEAFEELLSTYHQAYIAKKHEGVVKFSSKAKIDTANVSGHTHKCLVLNFSDDKVIRISKPYFDGHVPTLYIRFGLYPKEVHIYTRWHLTGFIEELTNYINYEP